MNDNERRTALILGADNAVGFNLARKLVRKHYNVVIGVKSTNVGLKWERNAVFHVVE